MPSSRLLQLSALFLLVGGAPGCGSSDFSVLVTLSNVPARAKSVAVTGTLDNKPLTGSSSSMLPLALPLDQNRLGVTVPMAGHLALNVQALDSDGCTQGKAAPELDLAMSYSTVDAPLAAQSPRRCGGLAPCVADTSCAVTLTPQTSPIRSVFSITGTDVWAVGGGATVLHFDGNSWTATPTADLPIPATTSLNGVWASASNDVWAVGSAGRIIHYDGSKWSLSQSGAQQNLEGISGVSGQSIWTVGVSASTTTQGEFWHYNGSNWESINPFGNGSLYAVQAVTANFVIGAGGVNGNGILWVWDGVNKFKDYSASAIVPVYGLWASDPTHAVAVGAIGQILRFNGTSWQLASNMISEDLNAVTSDGTTTYIVGTGSFAVRSTDPLLINLVTIRSIPAMTTLWTAQAAKNGLVWLGGDRGYLGYIDSRP